MDTSYHDCRYYHAAPTCIDNIVLACINKNCISYGAGMSIDQWQAHHNPKKVTHSIKNTMRTLANAAGYSDEDADRILGIFQHTYKIGDES